MFFDEKRLLLEGVLQRVVNPKSKDRYVLLFADLLVLCKIQQGMMAKQKYLLEQIYALSELMLTEVKPGKEILLNPFLLYYYFISRYTIFFF